jgi:hypothetical protein
VSACRGFGASCASCCPASALLLPPAFPAPGLADSADLAAPAPFHLAADYAPSSRERGDDTHTQTHTTHTHTQTHTHTHTHTHTRTHTHAHTHARSRTHLYCTAAAHTHTPYTITTLSYIFVNGAGGRMHGTHQKTVGISKSWRRCVGNCLARLLVGRPTKTAEALTS